VHNIILYLLCLPIVYVVTSSVWRYFRPTDTASAPWAAAAVTALFALHPALVESVVWISGRKYVLPNLFAMLALWLAVRARRGQGLSAWHAAAALVAFVAAMLSKASYVAVAPVIAMLWVVFWLDIPAPGRRRSQLLWPLAILFLAGFLIRVFIASSIGTEPTYFGIEAVIRVLAVLGWLARLAVSPESRHIFYPVFEDPYLPAMVVLGGAVLAAAAAGGVMLLRRRSLEGFTLCAFLLLCVPYMQLIPYGAPSLVSDRFLTFAVWPILLLIVALSWRLKPVPRTALLLAIALPWVFQTAERTRDWAAPIDADLRAYPGYYVPAYEKIVVLQLPRGLYHDARETANSITVPELRDIMIGIIEADYAVNVDAASTGKPQEAMDILWKLGLQLNQPPAQTKWNSPIFLFWEKSKEMLATYWGHLAKYFPDDVSVRYNAGLWMLENHTSKDAVAHLRVATESQRLPESLRGTAFKNLGLALLYSGRAAEAEAPLRAALEQSPPDFRAYCLLSGVYKQTGRIEESARAEADCFKFAPSEGVAK
jgi:tetratricopeptide (TPR) repeat protein